MRRPHLRGNPAAEHARDGVADGHGGTFVSDIVKMEIGWLVKKLFVDTVWPRDWANG